MKTFILKEEHVRLLRAVSVDMSQGVPAIDQKRPFGNSDITGDMARILGVQDPSELDRKESARAYNLLTQIYRELGQALQVVLAAGSFVPGTYVQEREYDCHSWRRAEHPTD